MSDPILDALNAGANRAPAQVPGPQAGLQEVDPIATALSQQARQPAAETEPSFLDQARSYASAAGRQVGLTVRAGVKGVTAVPGMFADAASGLYNSGADAIAGTGVGYRFPTTQNAVDNLLTRLGLPQPQNSTERVAQDAAAAMAGTGSIAATAGRFASSAASPTARALADALATSPATQIVSSGTGATAGGTAREMGAGPAAQLAAALTGTLVPAAASDIPNLVRYLLRGSDANVPALRSTLDQFATAGATPTVGQATGSRWLQATESGLSKLPGGAGPMVAKAEDAASKFGAKVSEMADALAPGADATAAGRAISQGIAGDDPGSFVSLFRQQRENLYSRLDQFIKPSTPIEVSNTKAALAQLNADVQGAPAVSDLFKNSTIKNIQAALQGDLGEGSTLPYSAIKQLRSLVGMKLSDNPLVSDVPRAMWEKLYGALSDDMQSAAANAGPQALKVWTTANNFTRAGMQRIDLVSGVANQEIPEQVFRAATSGVKDGGTMITTIMKSLPPESQKTVTAAFLRRLGQAAPGAQNEAGDLFSLQTFLTNWNKLSPQAKNALFSRGAYPDTFRSDMDKIAAVASNLREGSKVFANPSGTAQAVSNSGAMGSALMALLTGHPGVAAGIGAGAGGAYGLSSAMTNPAAVRWLASLADKPSAVLPAELNAFAQWTTNGAETKQ